VSGVMEVVGVVGSVKQGGLASVPKPEIGQAAMQAKSAPVAADARSTDGRPSPEKLAAWLRTQFAKFDPDLPPPEIVSLRSWRRSRARRRSCFACWRCWRGSPWCLRRSGFRCAEVFDGAAVARD
jgi:hypothetical protein